MPELGLGLAKGSPSPPKTPLWRTQLLLNAPTQRAPGQLSGFGPSPVHPGPPLRLCLCCSAVHPAMLPVQTLAKVQSQVPVLPQELLIPECILGAFTGAADHHLNPEAPRDRLCSG